MPNRSIQDPEGSRGRRAPLTLLLDLLSSIWFGVGVLSAIFLYSSIGSAVPPIRQGALADWLGWEALRFEMTEMEWFSSPVFVAMVVLFCSSMILATLRRARLNLPNLGVWIIHTGIIVMVVGCAIYFGRKLEGDAVIYQRRAVIRAPGVEQPATLVVRPGAAAHLRRGDDSYHVSVDRMQPRYEILSGPDKGRRTTAVWFNVLRNQEPRQFARVVLLGYPEYTEDVILGGPQGMQRAVKAVGRRLLDEDLRIELEYEPATEYFLDHTAALYVRADPNGPWIELPIRKLPRYYDYVPDRSEVASDGDAPLVVRPLDLSIGPQEAGTDGLSGVRFRATGFLSYARLESRWAGGGSQLNPVMRFSLAGAGERHSFELVAMDPGRNRIDSGGMSFPIVFEWVRSEADREKLFPPHEPRLAFTLPGRTDAIEVRLGDVLDKGPQPLAGTDYTIEVRSSEVLPDFLLMSAGLQGRRDSLAAVRVQRGSMQYRRLVYAEHNEHSRDINEMHQPLPQMVEPDMKIRFLDPAPIGLWLVGGPSEQDCEIVLARLDGSRVRRKAPVGEPVELEKGAPPIIVESLISHAVRVERPVVVPRRERQPGVGANASMLRVEVQDGDSVQSVWLPFNPYPFPSGSYAYPQRFPPYGSYAPRTLSLSDGRRIELLYSRQRRPLPAPIALERFVLETHPGGQRERDFISVVRYRQGGEWSEPREIRSNQPAQYGGLWFFQAEWDPNAEAVTVLGVGNRQGIGTMLTGVVLSILGMIYAFYVKPVLLRRRSRRAAGAPPGRPATIAQEVTRLPVEGQVHA